MNAQDVFELYDQLARLEIELWLDGGWAVDALLGQESRTHEDVDIVIEERHVSKLRELLVQKGYTDIPRDDTSAWNFVLGDDRGHLVDVHAVVFDEHGNGMYGPGKNGVMYPAESFTGSGTIVGNSVRCISAEYLVKFHSGYELDDNDRKDVTALCKRFGIVNYSSSFHPK